MHQSADEVELTDDIGCDDESVVQWIMVLALQPHSRRLQFQLASLQVPAEVLGRATHCVHVTRAAVAEI